MTAVAAAAVLAVSAAACGGDDGKDAAPAVPTDAAALGPAQPASGTPVKVGVISDGKAPALDNSIQLSAADAVTKFLNDHRGGLGGRPIQLVTCETHSDPGAAADCAAQLVQANVAVTVLGETSSLGNVWKPLHDADIPMFIYGTTEQNALLDKDRTFVMVSPSAGLSDQPISVAKENKLTKVAVVVIDVPQATAFYDAVGKAVFKDAGIDLTVIPVPPGTADMTPQLASIKTGETEVHVIGNDSFCIAAFQGLRAINFTGPISALYSCITDATRKAVGSYLKGVVLSTPVADGDTGNADIKQWHAIVDTYAKGKIDLSNSMGLTIYMTMMGLREALDGFTGELTPTVIADKLHSMPSKPVPAGPGLNFRCNGKAVPLTPAVCVRGALLTTLDAKGQPTLPYRPAGVSPIED
ncbi:MULTISPECIES: ABC transporter substrate-binding protein [unclassified Pseudofrankia]|uniref:ABC transporter substrate-binding protein n=1 Tax=unclassified Pseudofrankia TaxID=2994372 RepID=UPI0008DAAFDE|nr:MULTISPECIES: ABC transporter substrate-binding protein [unclassified Pseudofrankia]MDT3442714.1 ABC transporter substrate-binding protein [Pseudofrankia sp. BMG5.37]OHV44289.1 branched-chain amino acid ABC transporter substrate-binding protein [Pseudofrankia sp. BMG5.36]